jgi:hypothetical protein
MMQGPGRMTATMQPLLQVLVRSGSINRYVVHHAPIPCPYDFREQWPGSGGKLANAGYMALGTALNGQPFA